MDILYWMLKVKLPYGREKIVYECDFPNVEVLKSKKVEGIKNLEEELREKLKNPISLKPFYELCKNKREILLLIPDKTRAFPSRKIVPIIIQEILKCNPKANINIVVATGLHKPHTSSEIIELVGEEIYKEFNVMSHDSDDENELIDLKKKTSYGTPVVVNKKVINAELVIGLGLIEPHFFAGYSGGRKILLPGVASTVAVYNNHSYKMIGHPKATYGVLEGNPIHEDMIEFMKIVNKLSFIINVTINKEKQVTGVFCGDPIEAHLAGVNYLNSYVKIKVKEKADIVITTNGGFPLDRNVYQAVKGIATGELLVKEGGVIIMLSECIDGLGGHEDFYEIFESSRTPDDVLKKIKENEPLRDQWQAQILARILKKAKVIVVTKMKHSIIEDLMLTPSSSLDEAIDEALRILRKEKHEVKMIIVPEGPYVIPEIS